MFKYNCNNMENNKLGAGILQISTEERAINYRWEKDADKLDKNISIVCMDDIQNLVNDGWTFKTKMPIREGMTLALHPFISKCYIDINIAEDELFKDKFNCLGRVVKLLGAKSFEAKAVFLEAKTRIIDATGKINYKLIKADASYKKSEEEKYAKTYSRKEIFLGEFTRQGYEKAKQLIKQYKLEEDLNYIVEQRNPDDGNTFSEQNIAVDLSEELNRLTECAFSLNVLKGVFTLNANVKQTISTQKEIIIETKLVF